MRRLALLLALGCQGQRGEDKAETQEEAKDSAGELDTGDDPGEDSESIGRNPGNGGDAGYAVRVTAGSLTFTGGDDTDHVKGLAE